MEPGGEWEQREALIGTGLCACHEVSLAEYNGNGVLLYGGRLVIATQRYVVGHYLPQRQVYKLHRHTSLLSINQSSKIVAIKKNDHK